MTNFPHIRALINGVIIIALVFIFSFSLIKQSTHQMIPKSTFEVIDTYKGCDVVQYTNQYLSHYTYFLDCKK